LTQLPTLSAVSLTQLSPKRYEGHPMSNGSFQLHRYRHGAPATTDWGGRVPTITFVRDVEGRDDMQFAVIATAAESAALFAPGDHAVLRDVTGYPVSWGIVLNRTRTLQRAATGELTLQSHNASSAGWWDFLKRAQIHVLHGDTSGTKGSRIGNVWPFQDWIEFTEAITNMYGTPPGEILSLMFKEVARIKVPESLGGGYFGDEIPVVYDRASALKYAPLFEDIEPADFGDLTPDKFINMFTTRKATAGSLLTSMFVPESKIMELFPAFAEGGTEPYSKLASALGKRPVLVYRVRPWRAEPLYHSVVAKPGYIGEDFETTVLDAVGFFAAAAKEARQDARDKTTQLLVSDKFFNKVTLDTGSVRNVVPIDRNLITSFRGTQDDAQRTNAATVGLIPMGGDEIDTLAGSDLPILVNDQIEKHGLRMYRVNWPYIGPSGNVDPSYFRAAAAQVMQFSMQDHVLEKGVMTLKSTVAVQMTEDAVKKQTTFAPVLPLEPGQWFRASLGDQAEYLGYVEAIQHAITTQINGQKTATTTIQFSRGHSVPLGGSDLALNPIIPIGSTP